LEIAVLVLLSTVSEKDPAAGEHKIQYLIVQQFTIFSKIYFLGVPGNTVPGRVQFSTESRREFYEHLNRPTRMCLRRTRRQTSRS
jgi:hypothetical protein